MSFSEEQRGTTRMLATFTLFVGLIVAILSQLADSGDASLAGLTIGASVIAIGLLLRFESALRVGEPVRIVAGAPEPPPNEAPIGRLVPRSAGALSMSAGLVVELFGLPDRPGALVAGVLFLLIGAALRIEALVVERLHA